MNVCLLISYFSTNNSIMITKREICNFLSQLSIAPAFSSQQTPKKHSNFHRNFLEKLPRNQEFQPATNTKKAREILGGLPYDVCIYIMYMLCTTLVVSLPLLPHNPPHPPLPISTRPTSSRWVPPYVPWFCLRFLPDRSEERRVRTE